MKVLIDTNVLIDWISHRPNYYLDAKQIIRLCSEEKIDGCIAAHSITNLFYITRKEMDYNKRKNIFELFQKIFTIIPIDELNIKNSVNNPSFSDVEDCLQMECAKTFNADYIITRNIKDFSNSTITAILPQDFLKLNL